MKNLLKWFEIIAIVMVFGFTMVSCELNKDDLEELNGDWERIGQYVVTFNNGNGVFKEMIGDIWLSGKNEGYINIGEQCYRNFSSSSDGKWTGEIRIYDIASPHNTLWWEDCTITLSDNGQTLQISTISAGSFSMTKK